MFKHARIVTMLVISVSVNMSTLINYVHVKNKNTNMRSIILLVQSFVILEKRFKPKLIILVISVTMQFR